MDPALVPLVMPSAVELAKLKFTPKEWLTYYRNVWLRNAVARTIDVKNDEMAKAKDPEQIVSHDSNGDPVPVKERVETRKILVQDALDIVRVIDELLKTEDSVFEETHWSEKALAVAEDMMPKENVENTGAADTGTPAVEEPTPTPEAETPKDGEVATEPKA